MSIPLSTVLPSEEGLSLCWAAWLQAPTPGQAVVKKSSWSAEMKTFLGMEDEDRCLGLFIVAACDENLKDSRRRAPEAHNSVEWRD